MKKTLKFLSWMFVAVLSVLSFSSCSDDDEGHPYAGTVWEYEDTKVSHPLKHQLFSFSFVCLPPYPLTVNTCLTEVMQTIHILRPIFPTLQPLQGFCSSLCRFR